MQRKRNKRFIFQIYENYLTPTTFPHEGGLAFSDFFSYNAGTPTIFLIPSAMEKSSVYVAPAIRVLDVFFDAGFLQSAKGPIQDWIEDDGSIDF